MTRVRRLTRPPGNVKLAVKVVPGSSREGIAGWLGDELKIRVRQVPEEGKANEAVRRLLATTLELPLDHIRIVSGSASPHKTIEIAEMKEEAIIRKLPARRSALNLP